MSNIYSLYFYIGIFFAVISLSVFYDFFRNKNKKVLANFILIIAFFILTIVSGIRYKVGSDYNAYIKMYNSYSYLEPGSRMLFSISNLISENPQTIIFIYSILTNIFIILSIKEIEFKGSTPLIIATYLFLYFPFSLNIIRQSLAVSILLLAFFKIINGKKKLAIILGILACLVHGSAIFFIPYFLIFMLVKKEKIYRITYLYTGVLMVMLLAYVILFGKTATSIKYFGYLGKFSIRGIDYYQFMSYVPFLLICLLSKRIFENSKMISSLNGLFISGVLFEVILSSTQVSRIGIYFSIYSIFLIPSLLEEIKNKKTRKIIKMVYCIFLVVYFVGVYYLHGRTNIFPYRTIFTNEL